MRPEAATIAWLACEFGMPAVPSLGPPACHGRVPIPGPSRRPTPLVSESRPTPLVTESRPTTSGPRYACHMATLSREDVAHVAHLARLGLTEDEVAVLQGQLNHILDQYAVLATLDTEGIPPTAQTIEVETILREDVVTPSLGVDEALAGAPERIGDHVVVPAILGGAGD